MVLVSLEYQAQSPDEGALVTAARNFGIVFKVQSLKSLLSYNIDIPGQEREVLTCLTSLAELTVWGLNQEICDSELFLLPALPKHQ